MEKIEYKFRRDYSIKMIGGKLFRTSTRLEEGGTRNEDGLYLNPIKVIKRIDDSTYQIEAHHIINNQKIPKAIKIDNDVAYLSSGVKT